MSSLNPHHTTLNIPNEVEWKNQCDWDAHQPSMIIEYVEIKKLNQFVEFWLYQQFVFV